MLPCSEFASSAVSPDGSKFPRDRSKSVPVAATQITGSEPEFTYPSGRGRVLSGLLPALGASDQDLAAAGRTQTAGGGRTPRLRQVLIVAQVAASVLEVVIAGAFCPQLSEGTANRTRPPAHGGCRSTRDEVPARPSQRVLQPAAEPVRSKYSNALKPLVMAHSLRVASEKRYAPISDRVTSCYTRF